MLGEHTKCKKVTGTFKDLCITHLEFEHFLMEKKFIKWDTYEQQFKFYLTRGSNYF